MTATPRYYPAEDAPRSTKKVVAKVQNVSLAHPNGPVGLDGCLCPFNHHAQWLNAASKVVK